MLRRPLGETGLEVSVVGFGAWAIGGEGWGADVDDERSVQALFAARDAGVDLFDTAPLYGDGHADRLLRRAFGSGLRELTLITKAGARLEAGHALSDLSERNLRADVEASLERLGLERLDLLQVHWPCERGTPIEETLRALEAMKREGKIAHIGLCNYGPAALEAACEAGEVATLQTPLSLLRREYEHGLSEVVLRRGLGVLAYEPLARGLLSGKYETPPRFDERDMRRRDPRFFALGFARAAPTIERLRRFADKAGLPPAAIAIAWVASRPGVSAALAGAKSAAQVKENVRAAEALARPAVRRALDRL